MNPPLTAVFCDKSEKKLFMKYFISTTEHLDIAKQIGDSAVLLYIQYLRMATFTHPSITDEGVARSLGWTVRKTRRYREALIKLGYYKRVSFTRPDGNKMVVYHIGKEAVSRVSASGSRDFAPSGCASALAPVPGIVEEE